MSTEPKKTSGGPGGPGRHGFRKPKNTKKTLFRMFSYLSGKVFEAPLPEEFQAAIRKWNLETV